MVWMRVRTRRLAVACPTCDTRAELDDLDEADEMHRRHASVSGHALEWERADLDVDAGPPEDVEAAVRTLGETLDRLHELRLEGRLYEPRDDHLLHT